MTTKILNKSISLFLIIIFISGLFPPYLFSQPGPSPFSEVKGFNNSIFDNYFSKADREIDPERWYSEAKFGITQAIYAWEITAIRLYENPEELNEAKKLLENRSGEMLEKRFSEWLVGRFFGKAAEKSISNISNLFSETQKTFSWHLDNEGNIIFDAETGDPLVIRPNDENREFSHDINLWRNEKNNILETADNSYNNLSLSIFPELLAYIPEELRESMGHVINETIKIKNISIKKEFENIAAREESIFTSRRTRDIWSLRNKSENEAAYIFTNKLISETEESCKQGIEELNTRIEQAAADPGNLAILGEEWLNLYQKQFERGLKAWEEAEERFFIRRIEWEQDSLNLFSQGEETWLAAFKQFEKEREKWELTAKDLFSSGENMFNKISDDFAKTISDAKNEFELNMEMRIGEGKTKVKALIDLYLLYSSASLIALENSKFWESVENEEEKINSETIYYSYLTKAEDARNNIMNNYQELFGTGLLKDILSPNASSDDFYLDDYQIALIKARALVLYWKQKTEIAEAVMSYATELTAGRITETEGLNAFKNAKDEYEKSLFDYETKLQALNALGAEIQNQLQILDALAEEMRKEEEKLDRLNFEYAALISLSSGVHEDNYYYDYKTKLKYLNAKYKEFSKTGGTSLYKNILEYGMKYDITERQESSKKIIDILIDGDNDMISLAELKNNILKGDNSAIDLDIRLAAIDFLSDSIASSADWYSNVKGLTLTNEEKQNIYGEKLLDRLIDDYEKASDQDELLFCESLISLYYSFSALCPFIQTEIWQNTFNSLSSLFNDYKIEYTETTLPDIQEITTALSKKSGDFVNNAALFITKFDDCFSSVPQWLIYEIDNWKESLISYISAYVIYNKIKPDKNADTLQDEQANIINNLIELAKNTDNQNSNKNLILCEIEKSKLLDYMYQITSSCETLKKFYSESANKHWRHYLLEENEDTAVDYFTIKKVSSWEEGILADALFYAAYFTNRVNDSFNIFFDKNIITDKSSEYYLNLYSNEITKNVTGLNTLNSYYNEILSASLMYDYYKSSPENINNELSAKKTELENQEIFYNLAKNNYEIEARKFSNIGANYDNQYNILKQAQSNTNQKRFEYDKQDAIQRWAGTAYLNTDNIDLDNTKNKYLKAQTVLNVLSDLFGNNSESSFNDPAYNELYNSYSESFSAKIKVLETINLVSSVIMEEYRNNELLYSNYQTLLGKLGNPDQTIFNMLTVKNGQLAFKTEDNEISSPENFFTTADDTLNEYYPVSQYEKSLRELSERMSEYFKDDEKYKNWSYARDYLLLSLIDSGDDYKFLKNYYTGIDMFNKDGSIGRLLIKTGTNIFADTEDDVYEILKKDHDRFNSYKRNYENAWNNLSDQEKADLEYYVILTLTNSSDYTKGFGKVYTSETCTLIYNTAEYYYNTAVSRLNNFFDMLFNVIPLSIMKEINNNTLGKIRPSYNALQEETNNWKEGLKDNLSQIQKTAADYKESCEKLNLIENIKEGGLSVTWEDIANILTASGKIYADDLLEIKSYWEKMKINNKEIIKSVGEAFINLRNWAENEETSQKIALETYWSNALQTQKINESIFQTAVDSYLSGSNNLDDLTTTANNAYANNVISSKYHLNNIYNVYINNLFTYKDTNINMKTIFEFLGNDVIIITENIIKDRYNKELSSREAEWNQSLTGIKDKFTEWEKSAALILENGRIDWNTSLQKLQTAHEKWQTNFQNEYQRVSGEWALAYLEGLEDKESWLKQAENAFYQASSEALLSLIGTEGERLSRFIDIREPLGISADIPQTEIIMAELLQSSGIINMAKALGSINNIANTSSSIVKRGMGGISIWDTALVKTAASDMAKETNKIIANNEARKIAYNVRINAEEAIKNIAVNVQNANQKFKNNMDDAFIYNELWGKSGDYYIKSIVKGSTLFQPLITKDASIKGYSNYIMEPVILKANLSENYILNLDSVAINMLMENVFSEIDLIYIDIFGNGDNIQGKFNDHIGESPEMKPSNEIGKSRNEIFIHEGSGELGRMMSDMIYWSVIESYGYSELKMPAWERRMWNDEGSVIDAPSLRTVGTIACAIVAGIATGGTTAVAGIYAVIASVAISSASELIFTTLDMAQGYKTAEEAAFSFGKTLLTNTVTSLASGLFSGFKGVEGFLGTGLTKTLTNLTSTISGTLGTITTIATQTAMIGVQTFTSGLLSSALNGITYNSADGLGFSNEIFMAGLNSAFQNSLVSMTSTLVSTSLTAINSGLDLEKLIGFNNLQKLDQSNLNNLIGSLAAQGVNYALGNDFTLNVLNLSLLSNNEHKSGLLELHIGRDGVSMNVGTGGANVSIDNIISSVRGAMVWNVNSRISKYGNDNNFKTLIALRAQYGYGDSVQKTQLFDILDGKALLNIDADAEYSAKTTNENGKRVIHLGKYDEKMSIEEQFLLATTLGHEAYRDGYVTGEYDSSGNIITEKASFNELKTATIGRLEMADRINNENEWFYKLYQGLAYESILLDNAKSIGDYSEFDDYLSLFYNNEEDYQWLSVSNGGKYQNYYTSVPLFNSELTAKRIKEVNSKRLADAFENYSATFTTEEQWQNVETLHNEFINNKELQEKWGYRDVSQTSVAGYGCMFMSALNGIESATGKDVNLLDLHEFIKKNGHIAPNTDNLLSRELMATIMTAYTGGEYKFTYMGAFGESPSMETLNDVDSSSEFYMAHLRIQNPNIKDAIIHSVMVSSIDYEKSENGQIVGVNGVSVANSLLPSSHFNTRTYYIPEEIIRWDFFKVTQNR